MITKIDTDVYRVSWLAGDAIDTDKITNEIFSFSMSEKTINLDIDQLVIFENWFYNVIGDGKMSEERIDDFIENNFK